MPKRLSILVVVMVVAVMLATVIGSYYSIISHTDKNSLALIGVEDIHIPTELEDDFGLFFYDSQGNKTKSTHQNIPFDNTKPLIIFFNISIDNQVDSDDEQEVFNRWLNAGYNVGSFRCGQAYNCDYIGCQERIWGNLEELSCVDTCNIQTLEYSLAEVFVAYYSHFMNEINFVGSQIRFEGLALGVQVIIASCNYLLALEKDNAIDGSLLPDRVTCLNGDHYNVENKVYVDWLDKDIANELEMTFLVIESIKDMRSRGIAVEYLRTVSSSSGEEEYYIEKLAKETVYLEYIFNGELEIKQDRTIFKWYNGMLNKETPYDYSFFRLNQLGISPNTPTSYIYARMGTRYQTQIASSGNNNSWQYSINARVPYVAGFVFEDKNKNGIYDERLNGRLNGVEVELYLFEDDSTDLSTLIGRYQVRDNGYFEIPIEPIYLLDTNGKQLYIKVKQYNLYEISPLLEYNSINYLMTNSIKNDWHSDDFFIYSRGELIIKNIGLIEKVNTQ